MRQASQADTTGEEPADPDRPLRNNFFRNLRYMGYGGATLSHDVYDRPPALAIAETGHRIPLTTKYGATETQGATVTHWAIGRAGGGLTRHRPARRRRRCPQVSARTRSHCARCRRS